MAKNTLIWENSLSHYRVLGSCSPATFKQKVTQVPCSLSNSAAVFVDILRATTTLVAIGASGCKGIVVDKKPEPGGAYPFVAPFHEDQAWVFGGELNGGPITGVDASGNDVKGVIDNSPLSVRSEVFADKFLRFFSTNGAAAFDALCGSQFGSIFALSLANVEATLQSLLAVGPERIWLVGGGFYGGSTIEDSVAAGFLIKRLIEEGFIDKQELDDEAETMRIHATYFHHGPEFLDTELLSRLKNGQVAKLLCNLGHSNDVDACISGTGMPDIWRAMHKTALVCRDINTRLLVPEEHVP